MNMGTTHTPGPWKAHLNQVAIVEMSDGHQFYVGGENQSIGTIDANALLIAAAPELLAALEIIANSEEQHGDTVICDFETLQGVARAAIAKAKGI